MVALLQPAAFVPVATATESAVSDTARPSKPLESSDYSSSCAARAPVSTGSLFHAGRCETCSTASRGHSTSLLSPPQLSPRFRTVGFDTVSKVAGTLVRTDEVGPAIMAIQHRQCPAFPKLHEQLGVRTLEPRAFRRSETVANRSISLQIPNFTNRTAVKTGHRRCSIGDSRDTNPTRVMKTPQPIRHDHDSLRHGNSRPFRRTTQQQQAIPSGLSPVALRSDTFSHVPMIGYTHLVQSHVWTDLRLRRHTRNETDGICMPGVLQRRALRSHACLRLQLAEISLAHADVTNRLMGSRDEQSQIDPVTRFLDASST